MVKSALGDSAFYGRGAPMSFITDNCDAERKALAHNWPTSQSFLCIFHVLQQVWRWLLDTKHGIPKQTRPELMAAVKSLLYAKTQENFEELWEEIQSRPMVKSSSKFSR